MPRIRHLHPAIYIVRRLDAAVGALGALVARGAASFERHEGEDDDRGDDDQLPPPWLPHTLLKSGLSRTPRTPTRC
jgi:hypothetical protein